MVGGSGDVCADHHLLGELLAGFELGGGLSGAENSAAGGAEGIHDTGDQRRLGADYGEVNVVRGGDLEVGFGRVCGGGEAGAESSRSGIPGRGEYFNAGLLGKTPGDGVFPAPGADDECFQRGCS